MTDYEIQELERENILENRMYEQNYEIEKRIWFVAEFHEHYSKKLIKLLNPDNQDKMTLLSDIVMRNPNVSYEQFLNKLKDLGYVEFIEDNEDKRPILMAEGVDFYIEPHRVGKSDYNGMDTYLVVSKEVEKELQEWCDKKLNK